VESLAKSKPSRRVGLVSFAADVTIIGDGTAEPRVLAGTRLTDFAVLQAAGAFRPPPLVPPSLTRCTHTYTARTHAHTHRRPPAGEGFKMSHGVKDTASALLRKVAEMSEEGPTALGPAVLVAVGMASQVSAHARLRPC